MEFQPRPHGCKCNPWVTKSRQTPTQTAQTARERFIFEMGVTIAITPFFPFKIAYKNAYEWLVAMLTPKQTYETLTISASTLRRWAKRFENFLSVENHEPGTHRTYTPEDLHIFKTIQTHLENGLTYAEIENRLAVVEEPEPNPSTALLSLPEFQNAIENARAAVASMQLEISELKEWQTEMNAWLALPWWKRLFTKPPNAPQRPQ